MIKPQTGDRITVLNVPQDYAYKDLYKGLGTIDDTWNNIAENGRVTFCNGYVPFKNKGRAMATISVSGCGHGCNVSALKYEGMKEAPFRQFKDNNWKAGNAEEYTQLCNYWTVDFKDVN